MRIGVFGGTFDPPHLGHMILAMEAYSQLKLDRLLWVLTPDPPHKRGQEISPIRQRLALSQAASRFLSFHGWRSTGRVRISFLTPCIF